IAEDLHITKRTALRWRDGVVYAIAEKLGER
ncbi:RinA family phage transcriptional regulator, partial [Bacillus thuringiensis]|nr:RinA family phage transcriptional regulator [Bacillus thuringiensis]